MDSFQLQHPLVLVHGLRGPERFSRSQQPGREYFPGLPASLSQFAPRVLVPTLSPTSSIATRAEELVRQVRAAVGWRPVHLIGHSMGGLDARYAIARLGLNARSLTTVGTPHRGSSFADWGVDRFGRLFTPILRGIGLSDAAFHDLRTDNCRRFNAEVFDVPGVRYASVAGECEPAYLGAEWWLPTKVVRELEGANDGIVSVASAAWGERHDVWPGDHLNIVNWPNRHGLQRDRLADYAKLVQRLKECDGEWSVTSST